MVIYTTYELFSVGCCLCRVANSNVILKHVLQPSNLKVFQTLYYVMNVTLSQL